MSNRKRITVFVESSIFQRVIIGLIIINAIILGLETSDQAMAYAGIVLKWTDAVILKIFVIELLLRLYAYRWQFFKRPWCVFDALVVCVAIIPTSEAFAALRALRVLRVLRLISVVPAMRRVIEGLLKSVPGIASVATIMMLFFYVFAVIASHLYGDTHPQWFGTLGETAYSLFQIMTLESWSMGIVRPLMETHPSAGAFFIAYILVTTFTMLNLFIAIIVNAMHSGADEDAEESRAELKEELLAEIRASESRIIKIMQTNL